MRRTPIATVATLATILCLSGTPVFSQTGAAPRVLSATDSEWISLTGKVASTQDGRFDLDYGRGRITVEIDDHDHLGRGGHALEAGDKVTVMGRIDDDLFERRTIEAGSIYVDKLNTYFHADPEDEEGGYYSYPVSRYATDDEWLGVTGTVLSRSGDDLTLDTGAATLRIDTSEVYGEVKADPGDRVSVYGEMDDADLFEGRELLASSVIILEQG